MSHKPLYKKGDWLGDCDVCGATRLASELKLRWDGLRVDARCWEPRQPQDFVRGVADTQAPPWTRPEPTDTFIVVCNGNAIAGFAIAGCAVTDSTIDIEPLPTGTFTL